MQGPVGWCLLCGRGPEWQVGTGGWGGLFGPCLGTWPVAVLLWVPSTGEPEFLWQSAFSCMRLPQVSGRSLLTGFPSHCVWPRVCLQSVACWRAATSAAASAAASTAAVESVNPKHPTGKSRSFVCLQKIWKSKLRTTWKEVCIIGAYCVAKLFKTIFKACWPDVLLMMLRLLPDINGDVPNQSS